MFNVTFYKFNKEGNSTKRPTSGTTYSCNILRGSGLINPTIELNIGRATSPDFNYAYISDFGRYYYITEWTFNDALWIASLQVDVLATYRTEIGSENLYALRTSNSSLYDGTIVDNLYPTKTGCTYNIQEIEQALWTNVVGYGCFVLGVVSSHSHYGSLNYYAIDPDSMRNFTEALLDEIVTGGQGGNFNFDELGENLTLNLVDPLQYVKSCTYIPVAIGNIPGSSSTGGSLRIYNYTIPIQGTRKTLQDNPTFTKSFTVSIPKHPQTNARGNFLNQSPYTVLTLMVPPFGMIDIDTSVTCNASTITCNIEVDVPTGLGILTIICNGDVINRIESQVGVPISLSQVSRDYLGGVSSIMQGITGAVSSASNFIFDPIGSVSGAISSTASGIGNAITALTPRSQTVGTGGSYSQLSDKPRLQAQFFTMVDDDVAKNGRPCCKIVNCSSGGYFLIQDGDVPISGNRTEWEMIKSYLESGFYWE